MWEDHNTIIAFISGIILFAIPLAVKLDTIYVAIITLSVLIIFLISYYALFYHYKFIPIKISSQEFIFNPQLTQGVRFPAPVLLFNPKYKSHYKFSLELLDSAYNDLIKWKRYVLVLEKPKKTFEITPTEKKESLNPIFHYNDDYCFLEQEFEGGGKKELNFSYEIGSNEDAQGKYSISIYLVEKIDYKEIFKEDFRDKFNAKLIYEENAHRINIIHAKSGDPFANITNKIQKLEEKIN
ncbi:MULTISPECIES: hypothetical protein [Methanobacterium]|uniref:Uncharacterized protein n=1 Tax=Methanobacterium veterum TaxID=408577 RepID=A0A9E5A3A7_9EURY|nr:MULTISPECIES: hypothetical protein [Methanobacterium]MCZ3367064.1 hypothetical protein [Methanobacterium veterum]MCZ3373789.1 hypothetical protein [Methanobacterium veterum]